MTLASSPADRSSSRAAHVGIPTTVSRQLALAFPGGIWLSLTPHSPYNHEVPLREEKNTALLNQVPFDADEKDMHWLFNWQNVRKSTS